MRTTFRFLRSEEDDAELGAWEARMARRYYDKLFKEYCIADLSRYREQKIGMRWRVEKEVVTGKGQFSCGEKRCDATTRLASYEVHFGYREAGREKKRSSSSACASRARESSTTVAPPPSRRYPASGDGRRRRSGARDGDERRKRRRRDDDDDSDSDGDDDGVDEERREKDAGTGGVGDGDGGDGDGGDGDAVWSGKATVAAAEHGDAVWSGKATVAAAEPTREEEFDRYFEDMFA